MTTYLEILISLFLFSLALLGFDATQLVAWRQAKVSYYFTAAQQQLNVMIAKVKAGEGNMVLWNEQNAALLPKGRGSVTSQEASIFWGDTHAQTCAQDKVGMSGCLRRKLNGGND